MAKRHSSLDSVPDLAWESAALKARILAPLAELQDCTTQQMNEAAKQLKVSRATV